MRLALVVLLLTAGTALAHTASEGPRARLTAPLAVHAAPGTTIQVEWRIVGEPADPNGMWVRLLSRTGGAPTTAFVDGPGPYAAALRVPRDGIGGVRVRRRGTTEVFFALENDPYTSPGGVRCDVAALQTTLKSFVGAYNRGDIRRLDRLFSRERFVWYSSGGPGRRVLSDAKNRATLMPYFRQRHARGDRIRILGFRFNGYERERDIAHFALNGERRANDFRGGRWFPIVGKGALDCAEPPVSIAVTSLGGPPR